MKRARPRRAAGLVLAFLAAGMARANTEAALPAGQLPAPAETRLYGTGSGRFEVAAGPGEDGRRLAWLAEVSWAAWREPLGLPDQLPAAITVRLSPAGQWGFDEPWWKVAGEPGGVVSVWIREGGPAGLERDRRWLIALAEGALHRRAVLLGVSPARLTVPDWLTAGAAEAVLIRENPALFDAWQQAASRALWQPPLPVTLAWAGAQTSPEADPRRLAAFGVWQWLLAESGRTGAWRQFVPALLGGETPGAALVGAYAGRLGRATAAEIELAWQTGAAWLVRARATPLLEVEESRRRLEEADRIVVAAAVGGAEEVLRLGELWAERQDAYVAAEREQRLAWLTANFARIHPFYRNASGSLGRVLLALRDGDAAAWSAALTDWRRDLATGRELEQASKALLDEAR